MTFSITARDMETGNLGIAISTAVPAVGRRRCPNIKFGVGAITTQASTNVMLGINGLKLLELGLIPSHAIEILLKEDEGRDVRQVAAVDAQGRCFGYTGSKCVDWAGHIVGKNFVVVGNTLVGPETIKAMADSFNNSEGELSNRLLIALEAGQKAGGDNRGRVSAGLYIVSSPPSTSINPLHYHDLRVDLHPDPVAELRRIYDKILAMEREKGR